MQIVTCEAVRGVRLTGNVTPSAVHPGATVLSSVSVGERAESLASGPTGANSETRIAEVFRGRTSPL